MVNTEFIEKYFAEMTQILENISREEIDRVVEAL